ncbi:DNA polymerase I A, chloroplastic/mitochondrial-like [Tasmannia lanceolata]|uniref:DNA polymerase I A, chloroplastic/mitochondrial-like n=1 Tax=Tasmannia lanceolata TaxID=3420 RepID=UPI004063EF8D
MAMGVSTQVGPFKPYYAPSLWLSPSLRRSSSSCSPPPPSHALSHSGKGFEGKEICSLQGAHDPCFNSLSLRQSSGIATRQFFLKDKYYLRAYLRNYHSLMLRYSPMSLRLRDWLRVEEEKKQSLRSCINEPVSNLSVSGTYNDDSSCIWLLEREKVKEMRQNQLVLHNALVPQDGTTLKKEKVGSAYVKGEFATTVHSQVLDNIAEKDAIQNSFSQGYMGRGMENKLTQKNESRGQTVQTRSYGGLPLVNGRNNATSSGCLINNGRASHVTVSLDQPGVIPQYNGSLAQKLAGGRIELAGFRPDNAIERGISDRESAVSDDNAIERDTSDIGSAVGDDLNKTSVEEINPQKEYAIRLAEQRMRLIRIYDRVLVVDNITVAKRVVEKLTKQYKDLVHACDTEVAKIDVKDETPVDHGEIICFSIYSGPQADFDGKSCIWVDVLDGGRDLLMEFAPFFEDQSIKKVWHNYSFDCHVIENYGFKVSGFYADTMHLARLWDSSRRTEGGYSLEALTSDPRVMSFKKKIDPKVMSKAQSHDMDELIGKISMKSIFGKKKIKKDGSEGKLITVAPVEELQRRERILWICYSALDSMSTLKLFESLKTKLMDMDWVVDGDAKRSKKGTMYDFYEEYWRPFGEILVKMESEGMLVDREHLSEIEKVAILEQKVAAERFRKWASIYCPDAMYMNVGSDAQLRQIFFGGTVNRKDPNESLPESRTFNVPNVDKVIKEGRKVPSKFCTITLHNLGFQMEAEMYTATGWPSVCGDALKALAGKVSAEQYCPIDDPCGFQSDGNSEILPEDEIEGGETPTLGADDVDTSAYGTAYAAFGGGEKGRNACHAIAALCEVCSIDSLISNFILPLQGSHISGKNGRVHCSLNINTETGRLSARRPNLQNQPALEKDRYKIRKAFIAEPGNSLIVADYGQLELRILAHLANCKSMLDAFKAGGDFHSRTAMNMYPHIREAVKDKQVLLEWFPHPGEEKPPVPLLKDAFASERRKAKMLNFSIAYGKTPIGLSKDWKVSVKEAKDTVNLWYKERQEVLLWQEKRKKDARTKQCVYTLLGRARQFPSMSSASNAHRNHIERAAINTPVQGSAADVAMCAMIEISRNARLKELGWRLLLQVHDEVILEGPTESAEIAKAIVVECMSKPFYGTNFLKVDLSVDANIAQNWYAAK